MNDVPGHTVWTGTGEREVVQMGFFSSSDSGASSRAQGYLADAKGQREKAQKLSTSGDPKDKAEAARLDRLADRNEESAKGAINNALGTSNERR